MKIQFFLNILVGFLVIMALGCSSSDNVSANPDEDKIVIVDRDGREWDITHAVKAYKMESGYFNFGIGVGTIPSVDRPIIVDKDTSEYPKNTSHLPVFGVNYHEEQRAYDMVTMTRHEIVNDRYPGNSGQHVAVGY